MNLRITRKNSSVLCAIAYLALGVGSAHAQQVKAEAEIFGCNPDEDIFGKASLVEQVTKEGIKQVRVSMTVDGLAPGKHAVHIHQTAACEPCGAAGGHFDPGPDGNTSPDGNHPFHMGDLINLRSDDDGRGTMQTTTSRITLSPGPLSIFDDDGSALIVHTNPDTYCPEGAEARCAGGARDACGIIDLAKDDDDDDDD